MMKSENPFLNFMMPLSTLLFGFLSALLLPAPWFGMSLTKKLVDILHMEDIGQLYTLVFCVWFLFLGAIEYYLVRFIYRCFIRP